MTVQVNARVPDEIGAALDRWASELGIERSALVRDIIAEAVQAKAEGRASFERPEMPGPADLNRIVVKLDEQTTELDRILRQNARRDAELVKSARDDTLAVSEARGAIVADVIAGLRAALEVLHGELVRTREELIALMGRLPQFAALADDLAQIRKLAERERTKTVYNIGLGDWRGGMLASAFIILVVMAMGFYFALAAILPSRLLATPTANRLLGGGDRGICRLIDYQYGTTACGVQVAGREVTVTAYVPRTVRGGGR